MRTLKKFRRISALVLTLSLLCSQAVMARETDNIAESTGTMIPLEETSYTREEAMEILGISEEEAEKVSFYVVDTEPNETSVIEPGISTNQVTIGPQEIYTFPSFTFTGDNNGAYWTCNGTMLKWAAVHHSAADVNTKIGIILYRYGQPSPDNVFDCVSYVMFIPVGETYQSGWIDAYKTDYRFVYWGGNQSKVTMIVAVY